jgi:hypothetical protein
VRRSASGDDAAGIAAGDGAALSLSRGTSTRKYEMKLSHVKRWTSVSMLAAAIGATMLAGSAAGQTTAPGGGRGGRGPANPNNTNYPMPYGVVTPEQIATVAGRVYDFIDSNTASRIISRGNGEPITDFTKFVPDAAFEQKPYQIVSYEWGVTYSGLLELADATGDAKYKKYVDDRLNVINNALKLGALTPPPATAPAGEAGGFGGRGGRGGRGGLNLRGMTNPASLDDSGAMCAGLIKARLAGAGRHDRPDQPLHDLDQHRPAAAARRHALAQSSAHQYAVAG